MERHGKCVPAERVCKLLLFRLESAHPIASRVPLRISQGNVSWKLSDVIKGSAFANPMGSESSRDNSHA